jgi:hypothetical protein
MRKIIFTALALAVVAGVAVYAVACDQNNHKASATQASACPAMKGATASGSCAGKASNTALTGTQSGCPYHQAQAAQMASAGDAKKMECEAHKTANAGAGACAGMKDAAACTGMKDAAACAAGKCGDHAFSVANLNDEAAAEKIEKALSGMKNVKAVYADYETGKVYVCTGSKKIDSKGALKKLDHAGYKEASYVGMDNEHCVHQMRTAREKSKDTSKV